MAPLQVRENAWRRLASDLDLKKLENLTRTIPLDGAIEAAGQIMAGTNTGRILITI